MARLFGTDGVRGMVNRDLTPELAMQLGLAAGFLFKKGYENPAVVIGRDPRRSGQMLEGALMSGFCAAGVDVYLAGVIPTPGVAYLAKNMDTCAGVMISASHNPAPDNGIKFFNHQGFKLDDQLEDDIEEMILHSLEKTRRPVGAETGKVTDYQEGAQRYVRFLKESAGGDLAGITLVLDCANGAASAVAPRVFRELGAQVVSIHDCPDGLNINDRCGSTHLESLKAEVVKYQADLGLALDGDADRLLAVDARGETVDGDQIMAILALELEKSGLLGGQMVATVMSNLGLREAMREAGIFLHETKVGDRYVLEKMIEEKAVLGGEQSGHIIYLRENTTGDGIFTALTLLKALRGTGCSLETLAGRMRKYPQVLVNVRVDSDVDWETSGVIREAVRQTEKILENRGRLLVRASGTEPLVRVMAEGPDRDELRELAGGLAEVIRAELSQNSDKAQ
ncbi:MAG: phosphoglucosamine mutase [Peptococcaceae bacterium]|jgi:phosphoglucosamine mutase|nr:phosphoglucosamine mutase [Peptococcaceae bacterium]